MPSRLWRGSRRIEFGVDLNTSGTTTRAYGLFTYSAGVIVFAFILVAFFVVLSSGKRFFPSKYVVAQLV